MQVHTLQLQQPRELTDKWLKFKRSDPKGGGSKCPISLCARSPGAQWLEAHLLQAEVRFRAGEKTEVRARAEKETEVRSRAEKETGVGKRQS